MKASMYKKLMAYCRATIEDFDHYESLALKRIDRLRCPLSMACPELYDEMTSAIEDWGLDNDVDVSEIDAEDVFWEYEG